MVNATLRQTLADRYWELGLYDAAMPLQTNALETRRRELGDAHPDTLFPINEMGVLLESQGKLTEAETCSREAVEKRRRVLGAEDAGTLTSAMNVGTVLRAQGRLDEAVTCLQEVLDTSRRSLGPEHETTLKVMSNLAGVLEQQGKFDRAEPLQRHVLEGMRRTFGADHLNTLTVGNNLGSALSAMGRFVEAEPLLIDGFEGLTAAKDTPRTPRDYLREACEQVLILYGTWDKAEPGKGHDAKAAEWNSRLDAINATALTKQPASPPAQSGRPGG